MRRKTSLSEHIIQFGRFLRGYSFEIGPAEEVDALTALNHIQWDSPAEFKDSLRATLAKSNQQFKRFDELYASYWGELSRAQDAKIKDQKEKNKTKTSPPIEVIKDWLYGNKERDEKELSLHSATTSKGQVDLSVFSKEDLKEWSEVLKLLHKSLAAQPNRRSIHNQKPGPISLRPMIRHSMRRGGELIDIFYRHPKEQKVRIVLLCDVSKSMQAYTRFIIRMMYSLQNSMVNIETFAFSTSLYRITSKLKNQDLGRALESISSYVDEWASGTQIGACFASFLNRYANHILTKKTMVFIVSDGWDSGDAELLANSMKKVKVKSKKVFWFNPLAKSPDYRPETKGMKAALPYIDYLVPALKARDLKDWLLDY